MHVNSKQFKVEVHDHIHTHGVSHVMHVSYIASCQNLQQIHILGEFLVLQAKLGGISIFETLYLLRAAVSDASKHIHG